MAVSGFGDLDLKLASAEVSHPSESTSPEKQTQNSNQNENHNHQNQNLPLSSPENAVLPNLKNESLGEVSGEKTPLPISQKQEEEQQLTQSGTNSSKRGRPRKGSSNELAVVLDPAKNPDWLPAGWKVVTRTRPGGKSAGTKDTVKFDETTIRPTLLHGAEYWATKKQHVRKVVVADADFKMDVW